MLVSATTGLWWGKVAVGTANVVGELPRHPIGIPSAPGRECFDDSGLPRPSILPVKVHPQPTVMVY